MDCRAAPYPPGALGPQAPCRPRRGRVAIDDQGGRRRRPVRVMPEVVVGGLQKAKRGIEVHLGCEAAKRIGAAGTCAVGQGPKGSLDTVVSFVAGGGGQNFDAALHFHKPSYTLESLRLSLEEAALFDETATTLARLLRARSRSKRGDFLLVHMFFAHFDGEFRWLFSCSSTSSEAVRIQSELPDFRERALCSRRLLTEELDLGAGASKRCVGIASFHLVELSRPCAEQRPTPDVDPRSCGREELCYVCLSACGNRGVWHVCRGCGAGLLCDGCLRELGEGRPCGHCREPWPMRRVDCR